MNPNSPARLPSHASHLMVCASLLLSCVGLLSCGGAKTPPVDSGASGGSQGTTGGSGGGGNSGGTGGATGGAGGKTGGTGGSTGGGTGGSFSFDGGIPGFDGSIPTFDGGSGTCADLLACCNSITNIQSKTLCTTAYNTIRPNGDSACGVVYSQLQQAGNCP